MQFRQHQHHARLQTLRLQAWFALMLAVLALAINGLLAGLYKLLMPFAEGYPALFFETNTALILLFVLGGTLVETHRLRDGGGPRVAHWLGGRQITDPDAATEKRLLNVIDEMAMASGQALPQVFVLDREDAINAFVAGWSPDDLVLCVTRGALERLTRAELQGLVAHEFGHIKEGDLPLTMRLLAMVWGLSLIHGYGRVLMRRDERGRVHPAGWLLGSVFLAVGWLGWLAGRLLQAAIARQREFLADASAIQFTRSRDGLGNVLRKLWHDQQTLADRMRHPAAGMVASLLLHEPLGARWLASHPQLSERIRRICGAVLPPLPAPLVRMEAVEPRRKPTATARPTGDEGVALGAASGAMPDDSAPLPSDPLAHAAMNAQHLRALDRQALARLLGFVGPNERRLITLALMMDPDNHSERKLWHRLADGVPNAPLILQSVAQLLPSRRLPEFERMTASIAAEPIEMRRKLVEQARDLLRADGKVSPRERLWWLALRHRMGVQGERRLHLRPLSGDASGLESLDDTARQHIASLTAYLARFIPEDEQANSPSPLGQAWWRGVMQRCGWPADAAQAAAPDADALMHALAAVQELSWTMRPALMKAWVEEAVNHSPKGILSDTTADALRLSAGLIDAPMPPMLASHYPRD
ncbi:MAG: M48 family metalloprotease [Aquabacterium sp.]